MAVLTAGCIYPFDPSLDLSNIMVLELRLDNLVHGVLFIVSPVGLAHPSV